MRISSNLKTRSSANFTVLSGFCFSANRSDVSLYRQNDFRV